MQVAQPVVQVGGEVMVSQAEQVNGITHAFERFS